MEPEAARPGSAAPPVVVPHARRRACRPADGRGWKVFFSGRDGAGASHTGYATFNTWDSPPNIGAAPVLSPGPRGAFDDAGAMATWLVESGDRIYLYYIGWNRAVAVPFRNALGLAVSEDGGATFEKIAGPVLDRSPTDPYFVASAAVAREADRWRMWYVSCTGWPVVGGAPRHEYLIKYAESSDGMSWRPTGRVCVGFQAPDEYAISRPSVVRDHDRYRMWFSVRGDRYRIGYAESDDGLEWTRRGDCGLAPSTSGWDAAMVEYPCVFDDGERHMLYNGNGYGATGIGLADLARRT